VPLAHMASFYVILGNTFFTAFVWMVFHFYLVSNTNICLRSSKLKTTARQLFSLLSLLGSLLMAFTLCFYRKFGEAEDSLTRALQKAEEQFGLAC
jgi:hypothetical protein